MQNVIQEIKFSQLTCHLGKQLSSASSINLLQFKIILNSLSQNNLHIIISSLIFRFLEQHKTKKIK